MNAYELIKLVEKSIKTYKKGDIPECMEINRQVLTKLGAKFMHNGQAYFSDENGNYFCTENGGKFYF